ncbi:MAG TPA: zf-HC2 domain-containing protein [Planctomycetota bacterium]|nr:zf-HC2 domain-containing protein [Planctomycetota bacterium]
MTEQAIQLNCEQCRELLSDYIDRELKGSEKAAVEKHLSTCTKCGTESTRMSGLKKIVQHWDGVKGSGEFRKSVMEKMIRESQQMPSKQFTDAARDAATGSSINTPESEIRTLPPIWILLVAAVCSVAAYYLVLWLRGV